VLTVDPQNQERLAYCASDEILVSLDSGITWDAIPTTGAASAAAEQGFMLYSGDSPSGSTCLSVILDPIHPSTFYAIFTAAAEQFGAPPIFYMGFFTTNGGDTWQLVPAPDSSTIEDFGGFWNLGEEGIEALFNSNAQAEKIAVLETNDGGETWQSGGLSCPASGPCVRWGPAPSNIPGMGSPLPQGILSSSDGGSTWETIDPPVELRAPAPNQLVAISETEISIISGGISLTESGSETPALRGSQDAGASWQPVSLPPLSDVEVNQNYFPGLQFLSNHTYISQGVEDNAWYWLSPEMPIWCPVNTDQLPAYPLLLQNVGDQVWWVDQEAQQAEHLSLSDLTCAVE